uniref:Putative secreted protein n=1 Tax=Anopheles darlingi TaxID=43151 RepID=A0A2M4DK70_ANODA
MIRDEIKRTIIRANMILRPLAPASLLLLLLLVCVAAHTTDTHTHTRVAIVLTVQLSSQKRFCTREHMTNQDPRARRVRFSLRCAAPWPWRALCWGRLACEM